MTEKETRDEHTLQLEHGKPLLFGKQRRRGVRLRGAAFETFEIDSERPESGVEQCRVWDEKGDSPALAFLAAQRLPPELPTALGGLRARQAPTHESRGAAQTHG